MKVAASVRDARCSLMIEGDSAAVEDRHIESSNASLLIILLRFSSSHNPLSALSLCAVQEHNHLGC